MPLQHSHGKAGKMDRETLSIRAGAVGGIYGTIGAVVVVVGLAAMVVGFVQAVAAADKVWLGILAGALVALGIAVYVIVAWAGVQMFALVARYIQLRSGGEI